MIVGFRNNVKLFGVMIILCVIVVGMFELCSRASVSGTYVDLYGRVTHDANQNADYAQVVVYNKSSLKRYITASVKDGNWNTIQSTAANVGYNTSVVLNGVNVTAYSTVYAHCIVYNSTSPSSGTAETRYEIIK